MIMRKLVIQILILLFHLQIIFLQEMGCKYFITGQQGGDIFWVDSWQLSGLQKTTNVLSPSFKDS